MDRLNLRLKNAIWLSGFKQKELAKKTGMSEPMISEAIHGRRNLSESEQKKIAFALGRKSNELFE